MTHALCQDTRAKQQTKSVVNVSYRPTFSSAAEVDCTQWRLSSVTALPLLSFYVFFFILQDFIFHSVKIYIWFISSFSVKYLQMSNSFLWSSVNMQHKKIVAVTLLCYGTNVHICEEHRSQTCTSKQKLHQMNSSQGLIFQFMKFKTSPAFPWLLTVMCKPSLQDDITLSCCGISQRLRVPPDVLINAVVTLMLESHASLNPVGQTNQVLVRGWTYWGMLSCNWFTQICDCFRCDFNKQFFKDPELITNHLWLEPRHTCGAQQQLPAAERSLFVYYCLSNLNFPSDAVVGLLPFKVNSWFVECYLCCCSKLSQ